MKYSVPSREEKFSRIEERKTNSPISK